MADAAPRAEDPHPYTMRLSLSVLDHLGRNLYSNIPAVLSEVVANAWDADAERVEIVIDANSRTISVTDDGIGMTPTDLNDRFLYVGFERRKAGASVTAWGRAVMGRKGIGKLSLFAIADTVQVETVKQGQRAGLVLRTADIRAQTGEGEGTYHPTPMDAVDITLERGTRITLTDLRLRPTEGTRSALRRRLARRFSVIGPEHGFVVSIDGSEISLSDRDYFSKIEYLWSLGDVGDLYASRCVNAKKQETITGSVSATQRWAVTGWVGTVDEQRNIDDETNVVPVLARGKLIHEDLLVSVKQAGVFAKHLKAMGIEGISKSEVSRIAAELDQKVAEFRARPLDHGPYRYLWIDALTQRVREGGRVVNVSAVIATVVNAEGRREIAGFDIVTTEDTDAWTAFLRSLVARGLCGVELVISDALGGIKAAIATVLSEASWQRCRTHFNGELLAQA